MKKNILVTGGLVLLDLKVTKYLVKKNYKVTVFDNNFRGNLDD